MIKTTIKKLEGRYCFVDESGSEHYHNNLFYTLDYVRSGQPIYKMVKGEKKLICIASDDMIDRFVANYNSHPGSRERKITLTNKWAKKYIESSTDWMFDL